MNSDRRFMRLALDLARRGNVEPNPMVGAVVVRDGAIVGRGFHAKFGGPHAEIEALRAARSKARGADLYLTLEPCVAFDGKKTPPCADRVIRSGVRRVVLASVDPHPHVRGRGVAALKRAGISVTTGVLSRENERLNRPFFKLHTTGLPYVVGKWAMTLDGKIASRTGDSRWISSEGARAFGSRLRAANPAVVVGIGTVLADDPRMNGVTRIILDSWGRTPLDSRVIRTARRNRTLIAVSSSCPEESVTSLRRKGARVEKFEVMDLAVILRRFAAMGVPRVLIEGGGEVHASAFEAGLVDEAYVFVSPRILGGRAAKTPVEGDGKDRIAQALRLKDVEVRANPDGEIMIHGYLR